MAFVGFFRLPGQVLKMQTKLKFDLENDSSAYYGWKILNYQGLILFD